jgi:hypothetical protein
MAIEPGKSLVLCRRHDTGPVALTVPPSVKTLFCVGCQAKVYAAASTRRLVYANQAQPVCENCLRLSVGEGTVVGELAPGGVEEIRTWG